MATWGDKSELGVHSTQATGHESDGLANWVNMEESEGLLDSVEKSFTGGPESQRDPSPTPC